MEIPLHLIDQIKSQTPISANYWQKEHDDFIIITWSRIAIGVSVNMSTKFKHKLLISYNIKLIILRIRISLVKCFKRSQYICSVHRFLFKSEILTTSFPITMINRKTTMHSGTLAQRIHSHMFSIHSPQRMRNTTRKE